MTDYNLTFAGTMCPTIDTEHAKVNSTIHEIEAIVEVQCDEGYMIGNHSSAIARCDESGNWADSDTTCRGRNQQQIESRVTIASLIT